MWWCPVRKDQCGEDVMRDSSTDRKAAFFRESIRNGSRRSHIHRVLEPKQRVLPFVFLRPARAPCCGEIRSAAAESSPSAFVRDSDCQEDWHLQHLARGIEYGLCSGPERSIR